MALGCRVAVDPIPSPFAGHKPRDVASHVNQLKMKGLLTVDKPNALQKENKLTRSIACDYLNDLK